MKVAVVGCRDWDDWEAIMHELGAWHYDYGSELQIVTGDAMGADQQARMWADGFHIPLTIYCAGPTDHMKRHHPKATVIQASSWAADGKYAGPKRNSALIAYANVVVALWDGVSKGTKDSIDKAIRARKRLTIIFKKEA